MSSSNLFGLDRRTSLIKGEYTILSKNENSSIIEDSTSKAKYMLTTKIINTDKSALKECKRLEKIHKSRNLTGFQQLLDWSCSKQSNFCSTSYSINAFWELIDSDLQSIINDTNKESCIVRSQTTTCVLYGVLEALAVMNKENKSFNDVRPENIGVRADNSGFLRSDALIMGKSSEEVFKNQIAINNKKDNRGFYVTPEIWNAHVNKQKIERTKDGKNDVFALGMTILQAGTLNNVKECYK